jgi:hypothetical protein
MFVTSVAIPRKITESPILIEETGPGGGHEHARPTVGTSNMLAQRNQSFILFTLFLIMLRYSRTSLRRLISAPGTIS